jgi:hypothetical protein
MSEEPQPGSSGAPEPDTSQAMPADISASAFFLADHAVVENGKLYVNGGFWNQLAAPAFPVTRALSVAAVLRIPWHRHHEGHAFSITFEDADGQELAGKFEGQFRVGTAPNMRVGDYTIMPLAISAANFTLEQPGDYVALLAVDNREAGRWRFRALQAGEPVAGNQAGAQPS